MGERFYLIETGYLAVGMRVLAICKGTWREPFRLYPGEIDLGQYTDKHEAILALAELVS